MNTLSPNEIKMFLFDSIDSLSNFRDQYLSNSKTSFSRTQKITFRDSMLFPMVIANESTPLEILDFFPVDNLPSPSAMIYRRNQINVSAFKDLLTTFTSKLPQKNTFHGMRLVACDGTRVNTPYNPKDPTSFVNCIENRRGFNQYHLNTLHDILNDLFIDATIQNYFSMNEKAAFCQMVDRYPKDVPTIFVADRGYPSFNVMSHVIKNNQYFVIRATSLMAQRLFDNSTDLLSADEVDVEDIIHIGRLRSKAANSIPNYHYLRSDRIYDAIPLGCKEIDCLKIRLIKFLLPSGEPEYILTNLDSSNFSIADIMEIYRLRWEIETSYRYLKYVSGMVHIHSIKSKFIHQEIYAKLVGYNFCSAIMNLTKVEKKCKKYTYTTDKTYLFKLCIRFLKNKLDDIQWLIAKKKVPVRAGRKFERNLRRQHADTLQYR